MTVMEVMKVIDTSLSIFLYPVIPQCSPWRFSVISCFHSPSNVCSQNITETQN